MSNGESRGPYLAAAVLCEKVLQEKDGVLSAIRLVDRFIITASGTEPPGQMPKVNISITALIIFKSGNARGSRTVTIRAIKPSGFVLPDTLLSMFLEGEDDRGVSLIANIVLEDSEEGVYWFEVLCNDDFVTRMPLRVVYHRVGRGSGGTRIQ